MSKYEPLWKYLKEHNKDEYKLSFDEVKKITGFEFDHAFLSFKKELPDYGYEFKKFFSFIIITTIYKLASIMIHNSRF